MPAIKKSYIYKVYKAGVYVGSLPAVHTDFETSEEINTGGAQIRIGIAATMEQAGIAVSVDYLVDQLGNRIIDEVGNPILTRKDYLFTIIPVNLGNEIQVWLYDDNYPNGRVKFRGIITTWSSNDSDSQLSVTALSYGVQLDNYLVKVSPNTAILDYTGANTHDTLFAQQGGKNGNLNYNRTVAVSQTFIVSSNLTLASIGAVCYRPPELNTGISTTLKLYSGVPGGVRTLLETVTQTINNTTSALNTFTFPTPRAVVTGVTYSFELTISAGIDIALLVGRATNPAYYPDGSAYIYNDTAAAWSSTTGDYAFQVINASGAIGNQFNSTDPGDIMKKILLAFNQQGGVISGNNSTINLTNTKVSYTFKFNTILEGINKIMQLSPARWYWYIDPGTNLLYFQEQRSVVTQSLTRGKHVESLDIKYSLDEVKNSVYFTGGEVSGVNIVSSVIDTLSSQKYGQWLGKETDNRVTVQSTADIIAVNMANENNNPRFGVTLTVLETVYDIESFYLGEIVAFNNFNALINDLRLQIVSIKRSPDSVTLRLDTLPPAQSSRIEDIKRNLTAIETAKNPAE